MKKWFMIYPHWWETIKKLPREDKGELMEVMMTYINEWELIKMSFPVELVFTPMLEQFKIDETKYKAKCDKNKENIEKRWSGKNGIPKNTTVYDGKIRNTKHTDKDKDKDKDIYKQEIEKWLNHWNKIFEEKRQVTKDLKDKYISIRKIYNEEEFKKWYNSYKDKKLKIKQEEWEFKYLLSPLSFLTNKKNWFISYL